MVANNLAERIAVVTGGSRGIGRAVACSLASAGAEVVILYAGNTEAAEGTVQQILKTGGRASSMQVDVSNEEAVVEAFKNISAKFGRIDILVNNAGITRDNLLMRMSTEDWDKVIATNLKGLFLCTKAIMRPMMRQKYGRIINIGSVVGLSGNLGQANYAAAKAGVVGFTRSVAREMASRGITANVVAPGYIETDMTASLPKDVKDNLLSSIPIGRLGQASDIANAVLFFASDASSYVTGQVFNVDGGMIM